MSGAAQAIGPVGEALARRLLDHHAGIAAEVLEGAGDAEATEALAGTPAKLAASVLERMSPAQTARVLARMADARIAEVLPHVDAPHAAAALAWLDEAARGRLLAAVAEPVRDELVAVLSYPPRTAGALMDPRVVAVRDSDTVAAALGRLRQVSSAWHQVFVVDDQQRLTGTVSISELALAPAEAAIASVLSPSPASVHALAQRDEVVELLRLTGLPSLPVIDASERLVGELRHGTLVGAAEGAALADMQRMVGAGKDERALSPVRFAVGKRLPWLHINLVTAFLAASVINLFESTIAQVTSLAVLLPVIAGQSGNCGAQAMAVTMRGLALREVRISHWRRLAFKEMGVGAMSGLALAITTGLGVLAWSRSPGLAAVIAVAMVLSMAAAGLAGASIPIVLRALKQDPAQSSSIFLTMITDVVGFASFLGLATLMVNRL